MNSWEFSEGVAKQIERLKSLLRREEELEEFNLSLQREADRYGVDLNAGLWEDVEPEVPEEKRPSFFNDVWLEYRENCGRVRDNLAKIVSLRRTIVDMMNREENLWED